MPQFDVYRNAEGGLLLDCQSEALSRLSTRLVVPLLPISDAPEARPRLNPDFEIGGQQYILFTQFAAAVNRRVLRTKVTDLSASRFQIIDAFDMLLTGV